MCLIYDKKIQNVALDAGYRYNHWSKINNVKLHSHEVYAGVRVTF
ncbi:hypothetical protein J4530_01840 [Neisseria subflava]|nr:hypothetical protein [Neisseria subflava]RKV82745.1 MAG: hypothetical protein D8H97_09580 [Neisseria sp.]